MTQQKTQKRAAGAQGATMRRGAPAELEVGPPPEDDPQAQAQYFMDMLDAFAQQGTAEAKRLRSALIRAVAEYSERSQENKEEALNLFKAQMAGMEVGVAEIVLRSTRKIRDRVMQEARKLGSRSKAGQTARTLADGMTLVVDAMNTMLEAAQTNDADMRAEAHAMMAKAREVMQVLR